MYDLSLLCNRQLHTKCMIYQKCNGLDYDKDSYKKRLFMIEPIISYVLTKKFDSESR